MPRKVMSKIGDPAPVVIGQMKYRSHSNYVEAVEIPSDKVVWHTVLYKDVEPKRYDPNLEEDVQWNIINSLKVVGDRLEVRDLKGRSYWLD